MGREIKSNIVTACKFKDIPIYKSISAGYGSYENEIENYISVVNFNDVFTGDVFGVVVKGDSMEDTILDGTVVFIKKCDDIPFGKIGAFILNGCAYLKRLCEKEGEMVLRSDNSYYDDIEIKASDDFTIVGLYKGTLSIAK